MIIILNFIRIDRSNDIFDCLKFFIKVTNSFLSYWSLYVFLAPTAFTVKLHEISVEAYVPHAIFVPFIGLTSLRTDSGTAKPFLMIHFFQCKYHRFTTIECIIPEW